jgi:Lrp/AsnC family leucine-responsive transcriptional regulator
MHVLDAIDRKILSLLQADSRTTMAELADKVGLSVSPCHRRVKLLEERGVITRYIATVDQKSLGLHVSVFISIKLARQKEEDLNRFARAISKWDEVLECYLMTGNRDYLLRVVAADLSSYEAFLKNKLTRLDGIASIESSFALSRPVGCPGNGYAGKADSATMIGGSVIAARRKRSRAHRSSLPEPAGTHSARLLSPRYNSRLVFAAPPPLRQQVVAQGGCSTPG